MTVWTSEPRIVEGRTAPSFASLAAFASWPVRRVLLSVGRRAVASAPPQPASAVGVHLSTIVHAFFAGYAHALGASEPDVLARRLNEQDLGLRGFAFEGAAMALTLLDTLLPVRVPRLKAFIDGPAAPHLYMACVGAGWAAARLRLPPDRARRGLDPLLGWLAVDGYGFHDALFNSERVVRRHIVPARVRGYALRVFDQGVGRALWFIDSADVNSIARTIAAFPPVRRGDLWSGVALAATYAGGAGAANLQALRAHGEEYEREIAQGAAFAAEARRRAQNLVPHTQLACAVLADGDAEELARVVRELREVVTDTADAPAYEVWRHRIGDELSRSHGGVLHGRPAREESVCRDRNRDRVSARTAG